MTRTPSYERINYSLRPAKTIERKMIVEACSRLRSFYSLQGYRYIGFGSPYFQDFSLVHKSLGIIDMVCIEQEGDDVPRFEFNRPFSCISLRFGMSTEVLPELEWKERPTILWLDYDGELDEDVLSDIALVATNLASRSFLIITMRAAAGDFGDSPEKRRESLNNVIGDKLPTDVELIEFSDEWFPRLLWRIINAEIQKVITERSAAFTASTKFRYSQTLHFTYRDGARMLTTGGVIFQEGERAIVSQMDLSSLGFYRAGQEAYNIVIPKLTVKELRALDEQLPSTNPTLPGVPSRDITAYVSNYRYFPTFAEIEL